MTDSAGVVVLPEHTCWTLLRAAEVGRLAVCVDGGPDIFPINYVVDHGTIVFRTAEGAKFTGAVSTPVVAFEADGYDPEAGEAWSVVIKGHGEEIKHLHERIESLDLPLFPWQAGPKRRLVRILPEAISGRRFHVVGRTTPATGVRRASAE